MKELIFATNNPHKIKEIKEIFPKNILIKSLKDIWFEAEIPETQSTIDGNALQKVRYIHNLYKVNCMADDTGLEISSLNGKPGVYSARYAGKLCSFEDNMNKVLRNLDGVKDRTACFRTVIALIWDNKEYLFEGKIGGVIISEKKGTQGFGYDPIFVPNGKNKTFAELSSEEKNKISHRGIAIKKVIEFLSNHKS